MVVSHRSGHVTLEQFLCLRTVEEHRLNSRVSSQEPGNVVRDFGIRGNSGVETAVLFRGGSGSQTATRAFTSISMCDGVVEFRTASEQRLHDRPESIPRMSVVLILVERR